LRKLEKLILTGGQPMKYTALKLYHQAEGELWECMTETEREEYLVFLEAHPELENEIMNCDRRYYRQHQNEGDLPDGCKLEDGDGSTSPIPTARKGGMRHGPDFVDMIEQAACDKNGNDKRWNTVCSMEFPRRSWQSPGVAASGTCASCGSGLYIVCANSTRRR
jgi:hypothetical protein